MQTRFIIGCLILVVCLQAVSTDRVNLSQNQPLSRVKRFWGTLKTIFTAITTGAKAVDIVNMFLGAEDTTFGQAVSAIAQFDPPEKQQMQNELEKMMKGGNMTKENTARANRMMEALQQTMNEDLSTKSSDTSGSSYVTCEATSVVFVAASILALNALLSQL